MTSFVLLLWCHERTLSLHVYGHTHRHDPNNPWLHLWSCHRFSLHVVLCVCRAKQPMTSFVVQTTHDFICGLATVLVCMLSYVFAEPNNPWLHLWSCYRFRLHLVLCVCRSNVPVTRGTGELNWCFHWARQRHRGLDGYVAADQTLYS